MWNYIRARLIEMPQIFLGVDFDPVLNPLYAIPIVAVVLCAFLVYAFGFKSPVQPPSFDEIEIERKVTKKRKVKDNQKNKQQNCKISGSASKVSDSSGNEKKKKSDKVPAAEKSTPKSEIKTVKKSSGVTEKKKKSNVNQEPVPAMEDSNDEGWVHLVSKKGRKNRKKDDAGSNIVLVPPVTSHLDVIDMCDKGLENLVNSEEPIVIENKPIDTSSSMDEDVSEKSLTKEPKPVVKAVSSKKQKTKKKDNKENDDLEKDVCIIAPEEQNQDDTVMENNVEPKITTTTEDMKIAKEKKPGRKKKKKNETGDKEVVTSETSVLGMAQSNVTPNNSISAGLPSITSKNIIDNDVLKSEGIIESKSFNTVDIKGGKNVNSTEAPIEATGSNVAFDELEGLYPDSKPQRKKKKVRRDH